MKLNHALAALALAAAMALGACGDDDDDGGGDAGSDREEIQAVIDLGNESNPAICDKLTDKWLKNVVGGGRSDCEEQVENTPKNAIEVNEISVDGDEATVSADIQDQPGTLMLVKDGDEWKLDDIQGGEGGE